MGADMPIFLKIDGINGGSTSAKFKNWFEVDGFDFGATSPASTSGKSAGLVTFTPLTVDINSLVGLAPLLTDLTENKAINTVELVDVNGSGQAVYDIKLTKAVLHKFSNMPGANGSVETGLSFDFQRVTLTDHGQGTEGTLGPAETSVADARRFAAATSDAVTQVPGASKVHYFLKVDQLKGDSTNAKFKDWFDVAGFDFGAASQASTSGKSAGLVTFTPLTVDINSLAGLAPLLTDLSENKAIKSVELVEVNGNNQAVYDIKLTNASLHKVSNMPGANGSVETGLSFDFQRVTVTDHGQGSEGTLGPAETAVADARSFATGAATTSDAVTQVPQASKVHYFLKVDDLKGDVVDAKYKEWFQVDGFDFGATSQAGTSGKSAGLVTFTPLTVDINSLKGLAPLLTDLIDNKVIKSAELVEVNGANQAVYDIKLTNASLHKVSNMPGANGSVETGLSFDFQRVALTDHGQGSEGTLGPAETSVADARSFATSAAATSDAVTQVPQASKVHYFLKVDDLKGDVVDAKYKEWFQVDGFDFGATSQAGTSGKSAGLVTFTPLTVDINSLAGLAPLLTDLTENKAIKSAELVEVNGANQAVYDIKLTNASLHKVSNMPGANGSVETGLSFDFQRVTLTDHGQGTEGTLGPAETSVADARSFATSAAATSDTVTQLPRSNKIRYFLKVEGLKGDAVDVKYKDWFQVDGFDFGATRPVSTSGKAGLVTFTPLTVDINSLAGLAPLLTDLADNKAIKSVELVEADLNDQAIYDVKLSNASLHKFSNMPGANGSVETGLSFDFQRVALTDHGEKVNGVLVPETAVADARSFAAGAAATSDAVTPVPRSSTAQYFLKVEGLKGNATDLKHKDWFQVDGFDFKATSPADTTGKTSGPVTFSPLTVDINSFKGLAPLFSDLTQNKNITTVELVEVDQGQTVYDLKLTNAMLVMMQSAAAFHGVETSVAFDFQRGSLTDHGITSEGTLAPPQTANFSSRSGVA
jgi:type VI secretion system secreted protein Hcp